MSNLLAYLSVLLLVDIAIAQSVSTVASYKQYSMQLANSIVRASSYDLFYLYNTFVIAGHQISLSIL